MTLDPNVQQSWEEFLNPDVMRPRLISASIYIAGYESLNDAIITRIRDFFWTGFDESGDRIDPTYEADVLSRNRSQLYASLDWLKEMHAIDDADIGALDLVKTCRNLLAHRLFSMLGAEGLPPDFEECFYEMVSLLHKIELWWIREVEIPTNPDFDGQEIHKNQITPGRVMGLQLLCDIALSDEQASRVYFEQFRERACGNK